LVVAVGVDGEFAEGLAVVGDDAYVLVGDEEQDAGAGVSAADTDVDEFGPVAEGDLAGLVDAIAANPVVDRDGDSGAAGRGLGASVERLCRCPPGQRPVRSDVVVVVAEAVELGLQLGERRGWGLFGEPAFEGLVEALDLAAGLGVVGAGVLVVDPQPDELELDAQVPLRLSAVKMAPLSVSIEAG
jgi:hypothetical protein